MKARKILPYILAILLVLWMGYILSNDEQVFLVIKAVGVMDVIGSIAISLLIFLISGYQLYYLLKKTAHSTLSNEDILVLPAAMNLWSYLLPFRGGLIYSAFYIRLKYKIELTKGFSIGIYTFILSTALAGVFGIYISFLSNHFFGWLGFISILLSLSPLLLLLFKKVFAQFTFNRNTIIGKSMDFIQRTIGGFGLLLVDKASTLRIVLLILLNIILYIFWVFWSVKTFGFDMSFSSIVILALVLRLSVIARFIPGNVGIQELISGAATSIMGGSIQEGILVALLIRLSALVIAIILGVYSFVKNIDTFKTESFSKLWSDFRN